MDQLHEQEFTLLLIDALLNVVWAHLCSCAGPTIGAWFSTCPSTPSFYLSSTYFFITFRIRFGIPHHIFLHFSRCQFGDTIDDLGIHLLCCSCGSERIVAHDMFQDTIATIAAKTRAHIQIQVFHLFLCHTQRQMDIVITKDNFGMLINVIIANLISPD